MAKFIYNLIVKCKPLWICKDGVVQHTRWVWLDNLLYWLEGIR